MALKTQIQKFFNNNPVAGLGQTIEKTAANLGNDFGITPLYENISDNIGRGFNTLFPTNSINAVQDYINPGHTQPPRTEAAPLKQRMQNVLAAQTTPTPTQQTNEQPTQAQEFSDNMVSSTPDQYKSIIQSAAKQYGVPASLLSGLLSHESMHWNPDVISGKINSPVGAQGIAQFMPQTSQGMGVNPLDPSSAINGAAKKLSGHFQQFGSWDKALAAYNAGAGNVEKYGGIPPFQETQDYVRNITHDAQTGGN